MTMPLPSLPSLEQLKRQAKDLVKECRSGSPESRRLVRSHLPRATELAETDVYGLQVTLSEAQLVVAREHGFPSWPRLKRHVEAIERGEDAAVEEFKRAVNAADPAKIRAAFRAHPFLREQVNAPLFSFDSPAIVYLAGRGDRKSIDALLENGADINARSSWWAGGFGVLPPKDVEFGKYLIERGAIVDVWAASGMNMLDRLEQLITADPSLVNARGGDGQGPLHFAASVEAADLLLDRGADIDMRDIDHNGTPAQYMAADRPEICRHLLSRGAEPDIFMAVQLGDVELIRRLLDADPEGMQAHVGAGRFTSGDSDGGHIYLYTLRSGRSPLHLAAELGNREVLGLLLDRSGPRERLVAAALAADRTMIAELLAAHPGIVESLGPEHRRAVADAAWENRIDSVRLMLEIGFPVDAIGDHESTALNRAAVRGFADLVELLIANGASLEVKNEFGGRPLGACIWGALNFRDPRGDYPAAIEKMLVAGASTEGISALTGNKAVDAVLRRHMQLPGSA